MQTPPRRRDLGEMNRLFSWVTRLSARARTATQGRACDASVVVCKLRGFTIIAEQHSPQRAFSLLDELQEELAAAVHGHGGTCHTLGSEGIVAVFGVDDRRPDHAGRAVSAAIAMQEAVIGFNRRHRGAAVKAGVGVHSGAVLAGALKAQRAVIGDAVKVASRLHAQTKHHDGAVIVSSETITRIAAQTLARILGNGRGLKTLGDLRLRERSLRLHAID